MTKTRKQQLEELLQHDPNDPFLRYGLAMEYVSAKDDEGAHCRFEELFAIAPEYVAGYMQAGQALARLGRMDQARDVFRKGVTAARLQGNLHAAEEMEGMMTNLS